MVQVCREEPKTILIIDPNPDDVARSRDQLLATSHGCQEAPYIILSELTGEAGFATCQRIHPDCILLEHVLPDTDGLTLLEQLKSTRRLAHIPVVMVTAYGNEAIAVSALKKGAQDYLSKTRLNPKVLSMAVENAIEQAMAIKTSDEQTQRLTILSEQLRENQEFLKLIVDRTNDGIWDWHIQQGWVHWSGRLARMIGISERDITLPIDECYEWVHPEDRDKVSEAIQEHLEEKKPYEIEFRMLKRSGEPIHVHCRSQAIWDEQGKPTRMVGAITYIEERVQTQKALEYQSQINQAITNNMTSALVFMDTEQRITYVNPAWEKMTGYTFDEAKGKTSHDLLHPVYPDGQPFPGDKCTMNLALQQYKAIRGFESFFRHKDGYFYDIICNMEPIVERDIPLGTVIEIRDVTEEKRVQRILKTSEERYRLVSRATNDVVWDWDLISNRVIWNEAIETVLKHQVDKHNGVESEWWYRHIHENDRKRVVEGIHHAINMNAEVWKDEYRFLRGDGTWANVLDRGYIIHDENGKPVRMIGAMLDITERKRWEQSLQQSEERWRRLANTVPSIVWITNTQGEVIYFNERWYDFTGLRPEQCLGNEWVHILHPDDIERCTEAWRSAREKETPYEIELRYPHHSGQFRWMLIRALPVRDADGQVIQWYGASTDIQDMKAVQNALAESEQRFRAMADAAPVLIWIAGPDKLCNYFNQPWLDFTGHTLEEEYGFGWLSGVHPDDLEHCLQTYTESFDARREFKMEYRLKRHDGQYRWLLDHGIPRYTPAGEFIGFIGSCIDIHDRKLAEVLVEKTLRREQLIRQVTEISSKSFDLPHILGRIAEAIGQFYQTDRCHIVHYLQDEKTGNVISTVMGRYTAPYGIDRVEDEDIPIVWPRQREQVEQASLLYIKFESPDEFWEELQPYRDTYGIQSMIIYKIYYRGTYYGTISLHQCRYARVWTKDELNLLENLITHIGESLYQTSLFHYEQAARSEAEIANQRKSQFLAMMSHEFRTPLNAVIGYSEMLMGGMADNPEKYRKFAYNISSSGHHLLELVNDILDVSKIEAGKMSLNITSVDLSLLMWELSSLFNEMTDKKNIRFVTHIEPGLTRVEADPARLRQIFINLISNAVKFNRENGEVSINLQKQDGWMVAKIRDTGIGIPKNKQAELFTDFYQVDSSFSRQHEGTGLGLALTRRLVELHGGHISVESEEDQGSTFTIRLPLYHHQQLTTANRL